MQLVIPPPPDLVRPRRVLVVTSDVPFVEGGHRVIARSIAQELGKIGHEAEVLATPQNRFGRQFSAYLATWLTDVGESGDGRPVDNVISLRFPSYAVRHPRHVSWLNHRMREYYDLWPRLSAALSWKGRLKELVRRTMIRRLDGHLLRHNVTKLFVQSRTIAERLERWGGIPSEVLYPPPPDRPYRNERPEDFVFTVSRLHSLKRVDLLLRALAAMRSRSLRAVIAGTGPEERRSPEARRPSLASRHESTSSAPWTTRPWSTVMPAAVESSSLRSARTTASSRWKPFARANR